MTDQKPPSAELIQVLDDIDRLRSDIGRTALSDESRRDLLERISGLEAHLKGAQPDALEVQARIRALADAIEKAEEPLMELDATIMRISSWLAVAGHSLGLK